MLAGGTDDKRISVLYADALTMLFEGEFKVEYAQVVHDKEAYNN